MNDQPTTSRWRHWSAKFLHAFRGLRLGVKGQSSFAAHFVMAVLVVVAAVILQVPAVHWLLLLLCITMVLSAEFFNSALEWLAQAITEIHDDRIGNALDIGSAAVLITAIGSAIVGITILGFHLGVRLGWWGMTLM